MTNYGYINIVKNFLERCIELDNMMLDSFVIVCLDYESYSSLQPYIQYGCSVLLDDYCVSFTKKFVKWGNDDYKELVFYKLRIKQNILNQFHSKYDNIIYIDTDIWINKNFLKELNLYLNNSEYDIIFQDGEDYLLDYDECTEIIDEQFRFKKYCYNYCTGLMIMKSSSYKKIISKILSYNNDDILNNSGNQSFINKKLLSSNIKALTLPKSLFPNLSNCVFYKKYRNYWMLHYTYIVGKNKINQMKINNHWLL